MERGVDISNSHDYSLFKTEYRGYSIEVRREQAMGGWDNAYMFVYRLSDNMVLVDDFTGGSDSMEVLVECMKAQVDDYIANPKDWGWDMDGEVLDRFDVEAYVKIGMDIVHRLLEG